MKSIQHAVNINIDMASKFGKRQEILKTLDELDPIIRREKGCRQFTVSQSKQKDTIKVREKWASPEDALRHLDSASFQVLSGAAFVLAKSLKMAINIELTTANIDLKSMESKESIYGWAEKALFEAQNLKIVD